MLLGTITYHFENQRYVNCGHFTMSTSLLCSTWINLKMLAVEVLRHEVIDHLIMTFFHFRSEGIASAPVSDYFCYNFDVYSEAEKVDTKP